MAVVETGDIGLLGAVTLVACLQLVEYAKLVGACRRKYKVIPPEMTGPPELVRTFRAQQNCLEFFPVFLSCMWMSGLFFHQLPAAILGVVYIYARTQYFQGYTEDAEKRLPGFYLSVNCLKGFLVLAGLGITHNVLYHWIGINMKAFVPFI